MSFAQPHLCNILSKVPHLNGVWVKVNDLSRDQVIISKESAFMLLRDELGSATGRSDIFKIYVDDGTNSANIEAATNSSSDTNWHHVVFTFKAGQANGLRIYIDGGKEERKERCI